MSQIEKMISRRSLLKTVAATTSSLAIGKAVANSCELASGAQALGPFFPRTGTPIIKHREDKNASIPDYLANDNDLTYVQGKNGVAQGLQIVVLGEVIDAQNCAPIKNANIIIWQASTTGRYNHQGDDENLTFIHPKTGEMINRILDPHFQYWGRAQSNDKGKFVFKTILPGFYPADINQKWYRPPHIHYMVLASGKEEFVSQMYFKGEALPNNDFIQELNGQDLVLQDTPMSTEQRSALIVEFAPAQQGPFLGIPLGNLKIKI